MEVSFDTIRSLLTLIRSTYYMYVYSLGVSGEGRIFPTRDTTQQVHGHVAAVVTATAATCLPTRDAAQQVHGHVAAVVTGPGVVGDINGHNAGYMVGEDRGGVGGEDRGGVGGEAWILETICKAIEKRGLKKEGVFRAAGNRHSLTIARQQLATSLKSPLHSDFI